MTKKQRALLAVEALKKEYPDAVCSLTYREPLQLLIATRPVSYTHLDVYKRQPRI